MFTPDIACSGLEHEEQENTVAVTTGAPAPYASTASILTVISKHRQVGLRTIDRTMLQRIGVTEALAPRTLNALITLDFFDQSGQVTPAFDALRKAGEEDFKPLLGELLQKAYAQILTVVDPSTATPQDVENAFRGYEPTGQLGRMVQLFIGMFTYVGLMPERTARRERGVSEKRRVVNTIKRQKLSTETGGVTDPPQSPPKPKAAANTTLRSIDLGSAGSVTLIVDVEWLDLPDETFKELRHLIKAMEALAVAAPASVDHEEDQP
jgi:hypothetical protein